MKNNELINQTHPLITPDHLRRLGVSAHGRHRDVALAEVRRELIERVGRADATPSGAIPLGGGVHTGIAYVGPTGPAGPSR